MRGSISKLYSKSWLQNKQSSFSGKQEQQGKTKSNPRASVGRRSANNIQQGKTKGKSRKHGRYQHTGEQARQDYNNIEGSVE